LFVKQGNFRRPGGSDTEKSKGVCFGEGGLENSGEGSDYQKKGNGSLVQTGRQNPYKITMKDVRGKSGK